MYMLVYVLYHQTMWVCHMLMCDFSLQGLLFSTPECLKAPLDFVRLWLHETSRVYGDKMIEDKDMENLRKLQLQTAKDSFEVCICRPTAPYVEYYSGCIRMYVQSCMWICFLIGFG